MPPSCVARRRRTGEARIHLQAAVTRTVPCRRFPWDISTPDSYMELSVAFASIQSLTAHRRGSHASTTGRMMMIDDDELNDANAIPAPGCYLLVAVPSRVRACVVARAGSSAITPLLVVVRGRRSSLHGRPRWKEKASDSGARPAGHCA